MASAPGEPPRQKSNQTSRLHRTRAFGERHQTIIERSWIGVALGYGFIRIVLADRFLTKYGLSTKVFAVIELLSSLLYGFALVHVIRAFADDYHPRWFRWGLLALVGFAAPDIYVFAKIREVPQTLIVILIIIVALSLVSSVVAIRRRLKAAQLPH